MKLIPHRATPLLLTLAIRSLIWVGTLNAPEPIQCSTCESKHKRLALELFRGEPAISRFVRHFTTYPQVIPQFCNIGGFEPPRDVTRASLCPWVAHRVSGLLPATNRPVRTRFRCGSGCHSLSLATESNSLGHSSRGTPSGLSCRTEVNSRTSPFDCL
jgi:hypothetical protein